MLDLVLARGIGLPIVLSVVYVEVGRRAGIELAGVGLPGHFVGRALRRRSARAGDPFHRGRPLPSPAAAPLVRAWSPRETALRMLNNLVSSYTGRHDLGRRSGRRSCAWRWRARIARRSSSSCARFALA
jgi:regulator of sirC expression with transglutaminase-like and TPR domain